MLTIENKLEILKKHINESPRVIGNDFRVWPDVCDYIDNLKYGKTRLEKTYMWNNNIITYPNCEICGKPKTKLKNLSIGFVCKPSCEWQIQINQLLKDINTPKLSRHELADQIQKIPVDSFHLSKTLKVSYPHLFVDLILYTNHLDMNCSVFERLYYLEKNMSEVPKCNVCGKLVEFDVISRKYRDTCSWKCSGQNEKRLTKIKNTCLERYGVDHPSKCQEIHQRQLETLNKTISENIDEINRKSRRTRLELYGDETYTNTEQAKQTRLAKYGRYNPLNFAEKMKAAKFKNHGDENFVNNAKSKDTCLKHFGVENPMQSSIIREKHTQTLMDRYGVINSYHVTQNQFYSKASQKLFWQIYDKLDENIKPYCHFAELNREYFINSNDLRTSLDFAIAKYKISIEFHGDYWHMNPDIYAAEDVNTVMKKTAADIWVDDKIRINKLEKLGWKVVQIWENTANDEKNIEDVINNIKCHINSYIAI